MADEAKAPLKIRVAKDGKMLLLGCPVSGLLGKIALGRYSCSKWHIAIKTDNFQHPGCIDFKLVTRNYTQYKKTDTSKYSKCYVVSGGPGEFDVLLRWESGHSPYPKIQNMEVWCFGIYLGNNSYPKARDDYKNIAHVVIDDKGKVTVNGKSAGLWPEFAVTTET